ncbi:MAG: helix-turn-helix transcriptional regulator [Actinomycetia bacterium]|nr:helix-turn-helix transcriptional regulator [Actinomycetes bacterium]MCP4958180.1 helix-turn-helix transcriptional regulator [Actinomycetes bacterium]
MLTVKPLLHTDSLFAAEVVCRVESNGLSDEELESEFTVAFPRSGHFGGSRSGVAAIRPRCAAPPGNPLQVEETISGIVADLVHGSGPFRQPTTRQRALVVDAEEYLAVHYADDAGLPAVARSVGSSAHHLSRVFRSVTGTTLSVCRTQLRIRAAVGQIGEGAEDLTSVALSGDVGDG